MLIDVFAKMMQIRGTLHSSQRSGKCLQLTCVIDSSVHTFVSCSLSLANRPFQSSHVAYKIHMHDIYLSSIVKRFAGIDRCRMLWHFQFKFIRLGLFYSLSPPVIPALTIHSWPSPLRHGRIFLRFRRCGNLLWFLWWPTLYKWVCWYIGTIGTHYGSPEKHGAWCNISRRCFLVLIRIKVCHSPLTLTVVLTTLSVSHYRVTVWYDWCQHIACTIAHRIEKQNTLCFLA